MNRCLPLFMLFPINNAPMTYKITDDKVKNITSKAGNTPYKKFNVTFSNKPPPTIKTTDITAKMYVLFPIAFIFSSFNEGIF